jgi:uncharacterized protein YdeI (YjbR/CyaY-like superfamily)
MSEQITFKNRTVFRKWLEKNCARSEGLWLVFGKNGAVKTLTAEEALEEALCFGWIDGLIKKVDESKYIKFFSPRRTRSNWSEKNRRTAEELIQNGKMTAAGLQAIERAKKLGSWESRHRLIIGAEDIQRFAALIASNLIAAANFEKMSPSVKKQFAGLYLDAKQDATRSRRLEKLISLLEQNKKPM